MIPSGFEPETHSLEGCCSIQLSYGTLDSSEIGCKGRYFLGYSKILHLKSYVGAVVEGVLSLHEGLAGDEGVDVERVVLTLFGQPLLTLGEGRAKEGVAVGGQDNLVGLEVEGDDRNMLFGNGESVDDGEGDILSVGAVDDVGKDIVAGSVVGQQFFHRRPSGQQLTGPLGSFCCIDGFFRLGILETLSVYQTLAVAYHPYLALQSAIDNDGAGESLFGMLEEPLDV